MKNGEWMRRSRIFILLVPKAAEDKEAEEEEEKQKEKTRRQRERERSSRRAQKRDMVGFDLAFLHNIINCIAFACDIHMINLCPSFIPCFIMKTDIIIIIIYIIMIKIFFSFGLYNIITYLTLIFKFIYNWIDRSRPLPLEFKFNPDLTWCISVAGSYINNCPVK